MSQSKPDDVLRLDSSGRDVTHLPGLWSEEDIAMDGGNSLPKFALFGGQEHYARGGMCDLVSTYETLDEAIAEAKRRSCGLYRYDFEWWHVVDIGSFRVVAKSEYGAYGSDDRWSELGRE